MPLDRNILYCLRSRQTVSYNLAFVEHLVDTPSQNVMWEEGNLI